ncbi:D-lactate dehydrogenase [Sphingopyxis sp. MSC1_008]|jgi:D-lactate dehydrogenase|uniref:D-lactate dehydrogenase n=1 Tax=Sphingopyxis sp. MSC1_008 TaxID=2909265 RepID=UPI0020C0A82E|nr:D-lactate dehydrogenase [Sphingopyxis sp. MSC1_008]
MAAEQDANDGVIARLREIVGRAHVVTGGAAEPYARGYRFGGGPVEAAVRPGSLVEMWRIAEACVAADRILIVQAANTGLTGGSTPDGVYDRPVVVMNTSRIAGVHPIRGGAQVVCLAGATLHALEQRLAPLDREPHSVIGSSCIGASIVGGICNNSGGALVRRGPAYTEYALFARVTDEGRLELCNHLGIALGDDPEAILANLEAGRFGEADVSSEDRAASAAEDYAPIVRAVDAPTPARFNADPARLFEASGSAGKLIVFAVRVDSFAREVDPLVVYVGTNDIHELTRIRRRLLLDAPSLPISGEYIHRDAFDLADRFGKDMVLAIARLGTARLPALFRVKAWIDRWTRRLRWLPPSLSDRLLQRTAGLAGDHLPRRMRAFRDAYEHHLILKLPRDCAGFAQRLFTGMFPSPSGDMFECSAEEAERAMLHRFAVAGAAVRYRALHPGQIEDIVALDIALPRNSLDWFETLPEEIERDLVAKLYYGHFFCHVFHQDYLVRKGADPVAIEHRLLELIRARGGEYPAEHNVGHLYPAAPALHDHYRSLDPVNALNPGIGATSRAKYWK